MKEIIGKKIGIALEGGGAKGAFQVGALKAIREMGIDYHGVVGASIGAINGAMIAMDDFSLMESVWLSTKVNDIIEGDIDLLKKIVKMDFKDDLYEVRRVILETVKQGGLDITPYKAYLRQIIDEEAIRKSNIDYGLVTLSLTDLKPIEIFVDEIPEGKLTDYIMASANFPAFKMGKIDNKVFLDGGFFDNLPVTMLFERGYDKVIAIRIMGMGRIRKLSKKHQGSVVFIEPSEDLGKTLEIDPIRAKHNIKLGYYDTYRALHHLKGETYYITDLWDETLVFEKISKLPEDFCHELMKTLNVGDLPYRRFLFEVFIPLLSDVLKCPKDATYGEILLAFYESLASYAKLERLKFYTLESLSDEVKKYYAKSSQEMTVTMDKLSLSLIGIVKSTGLGFLPEKQKKEFLEYVLYLLISTDQTEWYN